VTAASGSPTARVELARLALRSAYAVPGVVAASAGSLDRWLTMDGDERLPGVVCVALPGSGYRVELHLVAQMVPLRALADRVRDRVERAAARAGIGDELRLVDIAFEDIDEATPVLPGEGIR
jgi:hypothetical protein